MEWVKCSEKLPILGEKVICWGGRTYLAFFPGLDNGEYQEHWVICDDADCSCTGYTGAITHWMELPEPPKDCYVRNASELFRDFDMFDSNSFDDCFD